MVLDGATVVRPGAAETIAVRVDTLGPAMDRTIDAAHGVRAVECDSPARPAPGVAFDGDSPDRDDPDRPNAMAEMAGRVSAGAGGRGPCDGDIRGGAASGMGRTA